jgi:hypothetical protein
MMVPPSEIFYSEARAPRECSVMAKEHRRR